MAAFVDTNVAVYAYDHGAEGKRRRAIDLLESSADRLVVSTQVLSEFYWAVTRKLAPPLQPDVAAEATRQLAALRVVAVDRDLVLSAIATASRNRLALWDALIVEAAVRGSCDRPYTKISRTGRRSEGLGSRTPSDREGSPAMSIKPASA